MSLLQITDNHDCKDYKSFFIDETEAECHLPNLQKIANINIKELSLDDNPNLLIFPRDLNHHGDNFELEERDMFIKWTKEFKYNNTTILNVAEMLKKKGGMKALDNKLTKYHSLQYTRPRQCLFFTD